jgi:NADPH:quinone reductase-like Zn-dependent oxidoreductase
MKAMTCRKYGGPDVLRLEEIERPEPGSNELRVRVKASSVNAVDWHFLRGKPVLVRLQYGLLRPKNTILGYDFAGTVEAVGGGVTRFQPGDDVFGGTEGFGLGGFAEYACIPEDGFVARKPGNVTFEQAAAVPGAAVAALIGLRERGGVRSGQTVLVNGASGGVGTFAVQIAKAFGARVTGVCSTRNVEMVRRLGAGHVVDYTRDDFTRTGETYDLLLDNVGNRRVADMLRTVRPGGTVVIVGFTNMRLMLQQSIRGPGAAKARDVTWSKPASEEPGPEHADTLAELLETGRVVPEIEATYPLNELPAAMRRFETEHARSKIVITM